jgi:hypothetical protein
MVNSRRCSSCLQSLAGMKSDARVCRRGKCRAWAQRHPGVPHPSVTLRTCSWCGVSIDHRNGRARFCSKEHSDLSWKAAHPSRVHETKMRYLRSDGGREYQRMYRREHIEARRRWAREARERNPERYRSYWRQWADANPELVRLMSVLRKDRIDGNPDNALVTPRDVRRLIDRFRGCCAYCDRVADPVHLDHVIPVARGGRTSIGNLVPACARCNQTKWATLLSVWRYRELRIRRP